MLRPSNSNRFSSNADGSNPGRNQANGLLNSSSADYLIPLTRDQLENKCDSDQGRDRAESCGYWETSFTREGVKAIARGEKIEDNPHSAGTSSFTPNEFRTRQRPAGYPCTSAFDDTRQGELNLSQSQSTQPLLENLSPPDTPVLDAVLRSKRARSRSGSVKLDASILCRQSYANVKIANPAATLPHCTQSKDDHLIKKNEISC